MTYIEIHIFQQSVFDFLVFSSCRFNIDPEILRHPPHYKFENVHKFHIQPPPKRKAEVPLPKKDKVQEHFKNSDDESDYKEESTNSTPPSEPISWAKVLDPTNLKPISLSRVNESTIQMLDESDNLSIFELLEQQSNSNSGQLSDTFVRKWIEKKTSQNEDDETVAAISEFYMNDNIQPLTLKEKENLEDNDSSSTENAPSGKTVHFSNEIHVNEIINSSDYNSTSTPNNEKPRPGTSSVSANMSYSEEDNTLLESGRASDSGIVKQRIMEGSDFLMERLKELEEQIDTFKKSNRELTKEKQDHDLEKANFEEEKIRFYNELNEDRIKMKNYFDQEKIRIDNEKLRLKRVIEDNNTLKKEKDLNTKLKKVSKGRL